jgi:hypothetical protein
MHKAPTALVLPLMLAITTGCATGTSQIRKGEESLAKGTQSVASYQQLSYEPLRLGKRMQFALDQHTTVFADETGRRFVKGFALPVGVRNYSVSLTSFKLGTIGDPAIVYPMVRVLDKDYRVVRTIPHEAFVLRGQETHQGLNTEFFVNENAHGERFLLVSNRPVVEGELVRTQVNTTGLVPVTVSTPELLVVWFIPTGSSSPPVKMKASPIGKMEIELKKY